MTRRKISDSERINDAFIAAEVCESVGLDFDSVVHVRRLPGQAAKKFRAAITTMNRQHGMIPARIAKAVNRDRTTINYYLGRRREFSGKDWWTVRAQVLKRDLYTCQYCGSKKDLTCDHVVPRTRGGTNHHSNLKTACRSCNSKKGGKLVAEWRA